MVVKTTGLNPQFQHKNRVSNICTESMLNTMFISVSNDLPKTSYIKMINIWLIFNLLFPFIEVLLHTYMDLLRDEEDRNINHHGTTIKPGGDDNESSVIKVNPVPTTKSMDLVSRDEEIQVNALKRHYAALNQTKKNQRKLETCRRFALIYIPILAIFFVCVYWTVGLRQAEFFN